MSKALLKFKVLTFSNNSIGQTGSRIGHAESAFFYFPISCTITLKLFCRFSSNTMTPYFISRVFEEHASARPETSFSEEDQSCPHSSLEMSLEDFSDFVLAWENRGSALGVKYFFPVFDTRHAGFITQVRYYIK